MYLSRLKIGNYKNFEEKDVAFGAKINCIIGKNGVGKTNLLDAIYYLSFCKSNFVSDLQAIKSGEDNFYIYGEYQNEEYEIISAAYNSERKKIIKYNDKKYDRISNHIGIIPLIFITPSDINLINGSGSERRRLLDVFISQYDKHYLQDIINYNRILLHRNKVLKSLSKYDYDTIAVYDRSLSEYGKNIAEKRHLLIEEMLPLIKEYYSRIAAEENIDISYVSQTLNNDYDILLRNAFEKDCILKHTSVGIHRDDIEFELNGLSLKFSGSQGQKKSFLYALKFVQYKLLSEKINRQPIILLDDMFDKLDKDRTLKIIQLLLNENFGQIFITDTDKTPIQLFEDNGEKNIQLYTL